MSKRPQRARPWYYRGLKFECTGCGGCCTGAPGYVWVNKAEIEAMAKLVDMTVEQFEKHYVRLVGIRKSLIEHANGDCVLLDNQQHSCRVYSVRPRQCRTWPFWESNLKTEDHWEDMAEHCPGANRGAVVPLRKIRSQLGVMKV